MENNLQGHLGLKKQVAPILLTKGIGWGLVAGLTGTLVMDLVLMGVLRVAGLPAFTCFSIVGDTVARFYSLLGIELAGTTLLGAAAHYLIGPAVGAIFGLGVTQIAVLQIATFKKGIVLAVLYVEIVSQPILATTPILLKMTGPETVQWYAGSFGMHFLLGVVLGAVMSYGLRLEGSGKHPRINS